MTSQTDQINKGEFLNALGSIKLRVEKQDDEAEILRIFVPYISFSVLATPNTQIIYGRNGTGKTHFFKAFYQYSQQNYEKEKIIPIYIDFRDLELGPVLPSVDLNDLILRFYRQFINKLIDILEEFSDNVITTSLLEKLFRGESANRRKKIDENVQMLHSLLNLEEIDELVKEYVRKVELEKEGSSRIGGQSGISTKVSLTKPDVQVGSSFEMAAEKIEKDKETIELVYRGLAVINYESIRNGLEDIIELCGAKGIVILVDEWSSISLSIQPLLAEMIRKTLSMSEKIILKIAGLKFFTQTSSVIDPPERIGFQSGIDIFVLADLDELLNFDLNNDAVKDFLTLVAYKHIGQDLPAIEKTSLNDFEDYICNELFENEFAYYEVVRSSEGNPRDFLTILSTCAAVAKNDIESKITINQAINTASRHFTQNKAPEILANPNANHLYQNIYKNVVKNRQKLFLISKDKAERDKRLQELWHYRFIHLVSTNYQLVDEEGIPNEYFVYSIDYGKLLALRVHSRGEKILDDIDFLTGQIMEIKNVFRPSGIEDHFVKGIRTAIKHESLRGPLRKITGSKFVKDLGADVADLADFEYLEENCIYDNLL